LAFFRTGNPGKRLLVPKRSENLLDLIKRNVWQVVRGINIEMWGAFFLEKSI